MFIINSIAPIFLLIALGKILRKTSFLPEAFFKGLNRLVFWFALPALLINSVSQATLELDTISRIVGLLTTATLLTMALAWISGRPLSLSAPQTGAFIQGAFRGNAAFISLPVIVYSMGRQEPGTEALATVVLAPVVILFNILGVIVLTRFSSDRKNHRISALSVGMEMLRNPLILACILGIVMNVMDFHLPRFIATTFEALGRTSLPLVLMSIGATLEIERLRGAASPSLVASLIKVVAAPLFGVLLSGLFQTSHTELMIAVFFLASPAAAMSYIMAEEMGNDGPLAGRIVTLSTLFSAVTIPLIMAIGL
ncbi:MAG: AEC family transporter [Pontiellaceae bacterium]|nr:AEC family transporter [Pontiellaceae bacterium]MBN2785227.1 AEC family transporter [Pontiellaceae bacterium]